MFEKFSEYMFICPLISEWLIVVYASNHSAAF